MSTKTLRRSEFLNLELGTAESRIERKLGSHGWRCKARGPDKDGVGMLKRGRSQRTIRRDAAVSGVGFLTGADAHVRFRPAAENTGIVFKRVDLADRPTVAAHIAHVVPRERRTTLQQGSAKVEMVEHLLAALAGLRIDNCFVEIDAPETPGLDGSSLAYVEALDKAGVEEQNASRPTLVIDRCMDVGDRSRGLEARPIDDSSEKDGLFLSYDLDYGPESPIRSHHLRVNITPETFRRDLAASRTFLLVEEARALRAAGIGARTSETDLLIFGPDGPIHNALRFDDECARHKILDMIGDFALAGVDVVGEISARRSGHGQNAELARNLLASYHENINKL